MMTVDSHFSQTSVKQDLFLTTKLQPPTSIYPAVSRPRLLQRLDQGLERMLTLICAPAGSGKTTLLTDWLRSSHVQHIPTAWISLDEGDNDPACFWRYICTALERIHPVIGEYLSLLLQTSFPGSETMLTWLINLLGEATTPFVLVLDDYHLITAEPILQALTFFIKRIPAHMHLVLVTRFEPSLPLARLRVRGQITEIREADLRFTTEEVERFFADVMGLPFTPMHIQALTERTEGWIAGLQLATLAMRDRSDSDQFMTSFTGRSRYIVDYLLEEVIDRQSEAVQTFLLSTSILGHMCASLCASVIGTRLGQEEQSQRDLSQTADTSRSCQMMLEHLERTNLFLIPLDHQRHWYRYHHLFAEALRARLTLLHPSLVAELHVRASIWYEQQGLLNEAIEHALTAGDFLRACHLIEQVASTSMLTLNHWTLLQWMKTLPVDTLCPHPRLCFLYAWALILCGSSQWESVERWIQAGLRGLPQDQDEINGEVAAIRAIATCFRGKTEETITLAQEALQLLPASHWQQGMLLVVLGSTFSFVGNIDKATRSLTRAIDLFEVKNLSCYFFNIAKFFLGKVHIQQGRLDEAVRLFQAMIEEKGAQPDRAIAFAYGGLGSVLLERNELNAARSVLQQGVEMYQKTEHMIHTAISIYMPLAGVQYAQGEIDAAFATLTRVEHEALHDEVERVQALVAAKRAHLHLQQGDISAAVRWAEERGLSHEDALHVSLQIDPREFEYLMLARVLIAQGQYKQASHLLKLLFQAALTAQRQASMIEIQVLQALNEQAQGAITQALSRIEQALAQAKPQGYIRLFADEGRPMSTLLSRIHSKDQSMQTYVQSILAACHRSTHVPEFHIADSSRNSQSSLQPLLDPLSGREMEVLHLLASGTPNAAIAQQLVIAPGTVKRHLSNIFSKLGAANRTQAAAQARELGIL